MGATVTYPVAKVKAIAIGCSTGGPQALETLFIGLKDHFPIVPIFITQHMPPVATRILAEHLQELTGHMCAEGKNGEIVKAGKIYMAPGNYHMVPVQKEEQVYMHINQDPLVNFCRPAVDPMVVALAQIYGRHLLVIILTGIGSDGLKGAQATFEAGGTVIAQNQQSSVVWGMPRAVEENKLCSAVLPIEAIASYIIKACA